MTTATLQVNGNARHAAAARYQRSVDDGTPLTGRELADEFGKSARWGRDVIAEARHEDVAAEGRSWVDTGVTLVVAVVAAAASFGHMHEVAQNAGELEWISWLWPLTVDGLVIAALRRGEAGRKWLALGLAVSVASNVLAKYPLLVETVSPAVAAWPPLALLGTHRLLHDDR